MEGSPGQSHYDEFLAWQWRMLRALMDDRNDREIAALKESNRKMREDRARENTKAMAAKR